MPNLNVFQTSRGPTIRATDATNSEGKGAYAFSSKHALAQYVCTGCLNGTYYASAEEQLDKILELATRISAEDPAFIAKLAIYARQNGRMKDTPTLLLATLSNSPKGILEVAFPRVCDNVKQLRSYAQIIRSGRLGRKSFGSRLKKLIKKRLISFDALSLFKQSIGTKPSLADLIKMVHPKGTPEQSSMFAYLIGKELKDGQLPALVGEFEAFKKSLIWPIPKVPFQMLTALPLKQDHWAELGRNMSWNQLRQNINTLMRHKALDVAAAADKLKNPDLIRKAGVFPYQIMTALSYATDAPEEISFALQDALEVACENVPEYAGKRIVVCMDGSSSMGSPVTGHRKGATTKVSCQDVAALFSAILVKKNKDTINYIFSDDVREIRHNRRDSSATIAKNIKQLCQNGGTNISLPLMVLNQQKIEADLVIYLSDNESWVDWKDRGAPNFYNRGTPMMPLWNEFKSRNKNAKLICCDLAPNNTSQVYDREDILNVGGFSDEIFRVIDLFLRNELGADHWVKVIEGVEL